MHFAGRLPSNNNYYRAELRENAGGQLDLRLVKVVNGTSTVLATQYNIGSHSVGQWWYLRFQVEGTSLRAKAWNKSGTQPTAWAVTATDSSLSSAGTVSIRSSNSASQSRPYVYFSDFRAQHVGLTVVAWIRPDVTDFPEEYVYILGKAENGQYEWAFRFRNEDTVPAKANQLSAYVWSLTGTPPLLGAGEGINADSPLGEWHHVAAVFDPGDKLDPSAGVHFFLDGEESGSFAPYAGWDVVPENGTAPLMFGTRSTSDDLYFTGGLDEIAIFDRGLSASDIETLYSVGQ